MKSGGGGGGGGGGVCVCVCVCGWGVGERGGGADTMLFPFLQELIYQCLSKMFHKNKRFFVGY